MPMVWGQQNPKPAVLSKDGNHGACPRDRTPVVRVVRWPRMFGIEAAGAVAAVEYGSVLPPHFQPLPGWSQSHQGRWRLRPRIGKGKQRADRADSLGQPRPDERNQRAGRQQLTKKANAAVTRGRPVVGDLAECSRCGQTLVLGEDLLAER
jgi:hypothetical protein